MIALQGARCCQMLCIHYNNGGVLPGVALAVGDRVVRVAVKDSHDAVEFRLINQVWVSEDCEVVEISFLDQGLKPAGFGAPQRGKPLQK